jgi:hypothetical protein
MTNLQTEIQRRKRVLVDELKRETKRIQTGVKTK